MKRSPPPPLARPFLGFAWPTPPRSGAPHHPSTFAPTRGYSVRPNAGDPGLGSNAGATPPAAALALPGIRRRAPSGKSSQYFPEVHGGMATAVIGGNTEGNFGKGATNLVGFYSCSPCLSRYSLGGGGQRGVAGGTSKSREGCVWEGLCARPRKRIRGPTRANGRIPSSPRLASR